MRQMARHVRLAERLAAGLAAHHSRPSGPGAEAAPTAATAAMAAAPAAAMRDVVNERGVQAPADFWDPAGFAANGITENFALHRQAEIHCEELNRLRAACKSADDRAERFDTADVEVRRLKTALEASEARVARGAATAQASEERAAELLAMVGAAERQREAAEAGARAAAKAAAKAADKLVARAKASERHIHGLRHALAAAVASSRKAEHETDDDGGGGGDYQAEHETGDDSGGDGDFSFQDAAPPPDCWEDLAPAATAAASAEWERRDAFFEALPPHGFTEEEATMRGALVSFLGQWNGTGPPSLSSADRDNGIRDARNALLPNECGVTLQDWMDQRIGDTATRFQQ
jgi:hypothetical protein